MTNDIAEPTNITKAHCQSCGSTSEEDIGWDAMSANDGYTGCCNERLIDGGNGTPASMRHHIYSAAVPTCSASGDCYHA